MARATRPRATVQAPPCCEAMGLNNGEICWACQAKGWIMVRGKWGMRLDHITRYDCGCVVTTMEQIKLSKCPTHEIGPMACCPKAQPSNCVCMYSYKCPEHGDQHIGTHD